MTPPHEPLIRRLGAALATVRRDHGRSPATKTQLTGNVITCRVPDGRSRDDDTNPNDYRRDAITAVVRITRQRVLSFRRSERADDVVEVFTLEPSGGRGRPRGHGGSR